MTTVVIPYRRSRTGIELGYCVRSMRKHVTGVGDIVAIGDRPKVSGVKHIPFADRFGFANKERNIFDKLVLACDSPNISDPFLYTNDDIFFLDDYNVLDIPSYYSYQWIGRGLFEEVLKNTRRAVQTDKYFGVHCPLLVHKDKFRKLARFNWKIKCGYEIKTLYCVLNGIEGEYCEDLKIRHPGTTRAEILKLIEGRRWFSAGDNAMYGDLKNVLKELYSC